MLSVDSLEVPREVGLGGGGEHRDPVLVAFAAADDDLVGGEVDVLDSEPAALEYPEGMANAVEEARPRGFRSASFAEGPRGDVPAARWQLGVLDRRAGFPDGHHRHSAPCGRGV
jgi:hypothetical protein